MVDKITLYCNPDLTGTPVQVVKGDKYLGFNPSLIVFSLGASEIRYDEINRLFSYPIGPEEKNSAIAFDIALTRKKPNSCSTLLTLYGKKEVIKDIETFIAEVSRELRK